jgi:hypothetical protein
MDNELKHSELIKTDDLNVITTTHHAIGIVKLFS